MTDALKGKTLEQADVLFTQFHDLVTGPAVTPVADALGKLAVLAGVREYPMRVKCASLAWHTMRAAMTNTDVVSTE
jgi:nitrogen fixation NifU-like protein